MRAVSTFTLRTNLSRYLEEIVKSDESLVVSRFGKPLVVITPFRSDNKAASSSYFGFLGKGESGETFLRRVRRSRAERKYVAKLRSSV